MGGRVVPSATAARSVRSCGLTNGRIDGSIRNSTGNATTPTDSIDTNVPTSGTIAYAQARPTPIVRARPTWTNPGRLVAFTSASDATIAARSPTAVSWAARPERRFSAVRPVIASARIAGMTNDTRAI